MSYAQLWMIFTAVLQTGQPHWLCSASLAVMAAAIWKKFDGTKQGALLAALLTVCTV